MESYWNLSWNEISWSSFNVNLGRSFVAVSFLFHLETVQENYFKDIPISLWTRLITNSQQLEGQIHYNFELSEFLTEQYDPAQFFVSFVSISVLEFLYFRIILPTEKRFELKMCPVQKSGFSNLSKTMWHLFCSTPLDTNFLHTNWLLFLGNS